MLVLSWRVVFIFFFFFFLRSCSVILFYFLALQAAGRMTWLPGKPLGKCTGLLPASGHQNQGCQRGSHCLQPCQAKHLLPQCPDQGLMEESRARERRVRVYSQPWPSSKDRVSPEPEAGSIFIVFFFLFLNHRH